MIDTGKYHHAPKRQALAQALGDAPLKSMEENIIGSIQEFCGLLTHREEANMREAHWGPPKDLAMLAGYLSFDVMSHVALAKDPTCWGKKTIDICCQCLPQARNASTWYAYVLLHERQQAH